MFITGKKRKRYPNNTCVFMDNALDNKKEHKTKENASNDFG